MRWFARRLVFYVFALWVAVTLNFLLPRLMPGDPLGGVLARLTPAQIQSNPGIIQTYRDILGGGEDELARPRVRQLPATTSLTFDFGVSTSNYPTDGHRGRRAERSLTRSSSSASASCSPSSSGPRSG